MKKILISTIYTSFVLLAFTINPSVSHASWWNPTTWFNNWSFNSTRIEKFNDNINIPDVGSENETNTSTSTHNFPPDNKPGAKEVPSNYVIPNTNKNLPANNSEKTTSKISTSTSNLSIKKCVDNICFVNVIKSCTNAQFQSDSKIEILGSSIKSKINFSISKSGNSCLLSLNPLSYSISPSQGLIDSMKGAQVVGPGPNDIYPKLNSDAQTKIVGKKGICNITKNKDAVVDLITKNSGAYLFVDPDYSICSGDLFVKPISVKEDKNNTIPKTMNNCKNIHFQADFESCVKPIVKTVSDCSIFSSDFLNQGLCIKQLAIKQKDALICKSIAGLDTNSSIQTDCYGEIAILKNDFQICGESNFKKNNQQLISSMALQCINKYCSSSNPNKWWGCK